MKDVFDGVLQRDDVLLVSLVHRLDHGGERGGLTRTGVAGDENEASRQVGESGDDLGEVQAGERRDLVLMARIAMPGTPSGGER